VTNDNFDHDGDTVIAPPEPPPEAFSTDERLARERVDVKPHEFEPPTDPAQVVCVVCGTRYRLAKAEVNNGVAAELNSECGSKLALTIDMDGVIRFTPVWPCGTNSLMPQRY
jgi:hypothetical protein